MESGVVIAVGPKPCKRGRPDEEEEPEVLEVGRRGKVKTGGPGWRGREGVGTMLKGPGGAVETGPGAGAASVGFFFLKESPAGTFGQVEAFFTAGTVAKVVVRGFEGDGNR